MKRLRLSWYLISWTISDMKIVVLALAKLLLKGLKLSGRNGSALPGLVVEKLYPGLLKKQLDQLENGVIVVTGTNGKTTTTKSLVFLLEQCGYRVLTNPTGSNFTRGIYATIVKYSRVSGGLDYDIAVLELDEAFSRLFAKEYPPKYVLALNVMRDQLDRYGEIDKTAEFIGETVSYATQGVILNHDDPRVAALSEKTGAPVTYFGVSPDLKNQLPSDDDLHGTHRKKHHKKGARKKSKNAVTLSDYKPGSIGFRIEGKLYRSRVQIAGIHNAFNLSAALATAMVVCPDMEAQFIVPTMKDIPAAFGRGEIITINDKRITLALVKNPSGFRQSLRSYDTADFGSVAFVINDDFADGRDVSWLWDVDFTDVDKANTKYTSGTRANDMALRLKYDQTSATVVEGINDLMAVILGDKSEQALVFCTYTAMLELRGIMGKKTDIEEIW